MKKNGFIASSLLYGMLALFLTLMISTIGIFANNKLSMDKLKEKTLEDIKKVEEVAPEEEKVSIAGIDIALKTTGDGLYKDTSSFYENISATNKRYVYKGANPDNYICLASGSGTCAADNLYRIIAIELDGTIKVKKTNPLNNLLWEPSYSSSISGITNSSSTNGTRYSSNQNDYCYVATGTNYNGCKSWGSSTSTYDSSGNNKVTQMPLEAGSTLKNLPTYDAYINVYLNGGKYLNTSNSQTTITGWIESQNSIIKNNVVTHVFNVGPVKSTSQTFDTDLQQESSYQWKGKVGLMNITDYVSANSNQNSCNRLDILMDNYNNYKTCKTTDWLFDGTSQRTITPYSSNNYDTIWGVYSDGDVYSSNPYYLGRIYPTFFLKSSIKLTGKGTNDANVYRIA